MKKGFRFRLILSPEQEMMAAQFIGCCRWAYNDALAFRTKAWDERKERVGWVDLANRLPVLKKEYPWLSAAPADCLQQVMRDLDKAFQNFFRRCKTGETPGYPKFKKKGVRDNFRFPKSVDLQIGFSKNIGAVKLPKLGVVKFRKSQSVEGVIQNATVSRHGGSWYISFCCKDVPVVPKINAAETVGIDRGVAVFAALSNGTIVKGPEPGKKHAKKLAKHQRRLAKQKKFSKNWKKRKKKIQKLHTHIANIRRDFLHKLSTDIVKNHAVVVIEELKTGNMTRSAKGTVEEPGRNVAAKSGLNRAILDQGWHSFETMLTYKLTWRSGELVKVRPHYTSQTCSMCGHCEKENRASQAVFQCLLCGHEDNADLNAAKNILAAGHVASACGGVLAGAPSKQEAYRTKVVSNHISSGILGL